MSSGGIDLSGTFAPIYWGFLISVVLFGISLLQGYIYFSKTNDRLSIQLIAGSMLVLNFLSTSLISQSVYYYLIPHFGSLDQLKTITPELSVECVVSTAITFVSQLYFVEQLYKVTKPANDWFKPSAVLTVFLALFTVCAFISGIACTVAMIIYDHAVFQDKAVTFQLFFGLAKGFGALADVIATVAMCLFLVSARTDMWQRTNSLLNSLMQFIINRGALVTTVQILLLVTFFVVPSKVYWVPFHFNVTRLYVNTFFAMLNGRSSLHNKHSRFPSSGAASMGSPRLLHFGHSRNVSSTLQSNHTFEFWQPDKERAPVEYHGMKPMPTVTKTVEVSEI